MSKLWSKPQALGGEGQIMDGKMPLPTPAIARYYSQNASASSVITLTDNTTNLEIAAGTTAALIRWVPTTDTAASVTGLNFDNVVPAGQVRKFVVPKETIGTNSVVGSRIQYGLYGRVAWISAGVGSVLATEY